MKGTLLDGTNYSGRYFQITPDNTRADSTAPRFGGWYTGWDETNRNVGPSPDYLAHYTDRVIANLASSNGAHMSRFASPAKVEFDKPTTRRGQTISTAIAFIRTKLMRGGTSNAMQAYRESRSGYEASRKCRFIAPIFDDEKMCQTGALKHLVQIMCSERLQRFVFY
jgi:hypothetical protein